MQVRAASELSVAGSDMGGGRLSEDDQGYSMDGRFSCSSLYSEFGHVASHLEERHPGVVLARCVPVGCSSGMSTYCMFSACAKLHPLLLLCQDWPGACFYDHDPIA